MKIGQVCGECRREWRGVPADELCKGCARTWFETPFVRGGPVDAVLWLLEHGRIERRRALVAIRETPGPYMGIMWEHVEW